MIYPCDRCHAAAPCARGESGEPRTQIGGRRRLLIPTKPQSTCGGGASTSPLRLSDAAVHAWAEKIRMETLPPFQPPPHLFQPVNPLDRWPHSYMAAQQLLDRAAQRFLVGLFEPLHFIFQPHVFRLALCPGVLDSGRAARRPRICKPLLVLYAEPCFQSTRCLQLRLQTRGGSGFRGGRNTAAAA